MNEKAATAREVSALLHNASFEELPFLFKRYAEDPRLQVKQALKKATKRFSTEKSERERVRAMYALQNKLACAQTVVGIDEVGRGALAGPLTVAAVVLPDKPIIWGLNDSKKLSPALREQLAAKIFAHAQAVGVAYIAPSDIDLWGMGKALHVAMKSALLDTALEPDCVLIDGNPMHIHPREKTLVKGDAKIASIAAASIVAKVLRDEIMCEYDANYSLYHFAKNKGYGTQEHIEAIKKYGLSDIHRKSFCGNFIENPRLF